MLEELSSRDGLDIAFAGRDEANLEPFLHFLCKYVADPRFAGACSFCRQYCKTPAFYG